MAPLPFCNDTLYAPRQSLDMPYVPRTDIAARARLPLVKHGLQWTRDAL
jgi:hypothetical protein